MARASAQSGARPAVGAYGLRLENVERARPLLVGAPARWPRLRVLRRIGAGDARHEWVNERGALLKLQRGAIRLDRDRGEATFVVPRRLRTQEIVHPLLAPVAAVMAYWLGRECFHASAFTANGRAWGLIGDRGVGKSTLAARLALDGVPIVCDDMLVVEDGRALAAPRSIDLRRRSAEHLGVGEALGVVGARERWRLRLGAVERQPPLAGWIFLGWGPQVEVEAVRGHERLLRLTSHRGARLPPRDADALLALAALPAWELRRPRGFRSLSDSVERLLATVG